MSYNNYTDADAAWRAAFDHEEICVAIIKHANPCGIAISSVSVADAHRKAHECDPLSAFGGVIAANTTVSVEMAETVADIFTEVIIAPAYEDGAVEVLARKKNIRVLVASEPQLGGTEFRQISGGLLLQQRDALDAPGDDPANWTLATGEPADPATLADLKFAWRTCRAVKSNAIVVAKDGATVGVGMGQVNRVDAARLAVERAGDRVRGRGRRLRRVLPVPGRPGDADRRRGEGDRAPGRVDARRRRHRGRRQGRRHAVPNRRAALRALTVELNDRMYRLLQRPMRMLSLRMIVIVAGLSVIAVVILIGTWVWLGITNDQYNQLDRRLDSVSSLGDLSTLLSTAQPNGVPDEHSPEGSLVRTARIAGLTLSVPADIVLPQLENGYANTTINGVEYRVRTFSAGRASIALGAPLAETQRRIDALHMRVLIICGSVIVGTFLVGWVISLVMVNPFRLLAQQARAINAQSNPDEVQVRGVREAVEIGEAVEGMLGAHRRRAAAHQGGAGIGPRLRGRRLPRTAHPADGDAHQPRGAVHPGPARRAAQGGDRRRHPDAVPDRGHADGAGTARAGRADHRRRFRAGRHHRAARPRRARRDAHLPGPRRVAGAVDHGAHRRAARGPAAGDRQRDRQRRQARRRHPDPAGRRQLGAGVEITIDDNGTGVPEEERDAVFERFSRGSTASRSGSGLGLALVAQQAELHGGTAALEASPLGGTRLVLRLPGTH